MVEQNSIYLDGETELEQVKENNQALKRLALRKEEWLKTYQFLLMKAGQTEPLQANSPVYTRCHCFTFGVYCGRVV